MRRQLPSPRIHQQRLLHPRQRPPGRDMDLCDPSPGAEPCKAWGHPRDPSCVGNCGVWVSGTAGCSPPHPKFPNPPGPGEGAAGLSRPWERGMAAVGPEGDGCRAGRCHSSEGWQQLLRHGLGPQRIPGEGNREWGRCPGGGVGRGAAGSGFGVWGSLPRRCVTPRLKSRLPLIRILIRSKSHF